MVTRLFVDEVGIQDAIKRYINDMLDMGSPTEYYVYAASLTWFILDGARFSKSALKNIIKEEAPFFADYDDTSSIDSFYDELTEIVWEFGTDERESTQEQEEQQQEQQQEQQEEQPPRRRPAISNIYDDEYEDVCDVYYAPRIDDDAIDINQSEQVGEEDEALFKWLSVRLSSLLNLSKDLFTDETNIYELADELSKPDANIRILLEEEALEEADLEDLIAEVENLRMGRIDNKLQKAVFREAFISEFSDEFEEFDETNKETEFIDLVWNINDNLLTGDMVNQLFELVPSLKNQNIMLIIQLLKEAMAKMPSPPSEIPVDMQDLFGRQQSPEEFKNKADRRYKHEIEPIYDQCSYVIENPDLRYLKESLRRMELFCRQQKYLEKREFLEKIQINYSRTQKFSISWANRDGKPFPPKNIYRKLLKILEKVNIIEENVKIEIQLKDKHSVAVDMGGVVRSLFTRVGEHMKNILTEKDGRYNFPRSMRPQEIQNCLHIIAVALHQGLVLGIPLSYGALAAINGTGDTLTLPVLLELYRRDVDPITFKSVLLSTPGEGEEREDEYLTEYIPETNFVVPKTKPLDQDSEPEPVQINYQSRYEWLARVLFYRVFPLGVKTSVIRGYFEDIKNPTLALLVGAVSLAELEKAIGSPVLREDLKLGYVRILYEGIEDIPEEEETADMLKHRKWFMNYADEHPEDIARLYQLSSGSVDPTDKFRFELNEDHQGLPFGHTCFNYVTIHPYKDYKTFSKEMEISLANVESLGAA